MAISLLVGRTLGPHDPELGIKISADTGRAVPLCTSIKSGDAILTNGTGAQCNSVSFCANVLIAGHVLKSGSAHKLHLACD